MPAPTAIIAEDEDVLRQELRDHLAQLWPELHIVAEAANGIEALSHFDRYRPDILFLDIQMPGLSGLDVARQVEGKCHIVFVTAYDAHATAAFEQGAVDYFLKPYDAGRLMLALRRVRQRLVSTPAPMPDVLSDVAHATAGRTYLKWINASRGTGVQLITVDEVSYFQSDAKYTRVVTAEGESLIRKPLKELLDELDPSHFWQIHRSTIVNVQAVSGVTRDLSGALQVKLKNRLEKLEVSDAHRHLFKQM